MQNEVRPRRMQTQKVPVPCLQCGLLLTSDESCPMDEIDHDVQRAAVEGVALNRMDYETQGIYGVPRWFIYRKQLTAKLLFEHTKANETTEEEFDEFVMVMDAATGVFSMDIPEEWAATEA